MKSICLTVLFFVFSALKGQTILSQEKFEGNIDGKIRVTLYLKIEETGCPSIIAHGIYKYAHQKNSSWILLNTTFSEKDQNYTFVENENTGIMLLYKSDDSLRGLWISPDGKKQLKVELKKVPATKAETEFLENALEQANYEAHDC